LDNAIRAQRVFAGKLSFAAHYALIELFIYFALFDSKAGGMKLQAQKAERRFNFNCKK